MSTELASYKDKLFSIHIIDQGISIYSENFSDFMNIDDILVFGFISALHSYTYAIGNEEIKSIDFGSCKFLFKPLDDGKLIVAITKTDFNLNDKSQLLDNIRLRYEILRKGQKIEEVKSLFDLKERFIPLELVAEIRKKGKNKEEKQQGLDTQSFSPPVIPTVNVEEFYIESLMNDEFLNSKNLINIRKTLSNFFLGYKQTLASLFVIAKGEQLTSFVFSRKKIEEIFPLIQSTITNATITHINIDGTTNNIEKIDFKDRFLWTLTHATTRYSARAIFYSYSRSELEAISTHLSRIMYFVNQLL